jgi:hypothetical protein
MTASDSARTIVTKVRSLLSSPKRPSLTRLRRPGGRRSRLNAEVLVSQLDVTWVDADFAVGAAFPPTQISDLALSHDQLRAIVRWVEDRARRRAEPAVLCWSELVAIVDPLAP